MGILFLLQAGFMAVMTLLGAIAAHPAPRPDCPAQMGQQPCPSTTK